LATILLVDDDPFQAYAHRMALEREFASIERASSASEAFVRVEQRDFAENLALIVVGLRLPGLAGPAFVTELVARVPGVPLLVIGRDGETAAEYSDQSLRFLPRDASSDDLLAEVRSMFPTNERRGSLRLVERRF
jgi:DNA-binding NtrC family response regulator